MTSQITYPYDVTGQAATNLITEEKHTISPSQGAHYALIVPVAAPYFREGVVITHVASGKVLKEYVDFTYTHFIIDISNQIDESVYSSITILNADVLGEIELQYQTIGGDFTLDEQTMAEAAIHLLESNGAYPWDEVSGKPDEYPVSEHELPAETIYGMDEVVDAIERLEYLSDVAVEIPNVRHLPDVLGSKLDNSGEFKILTDASIETKGFEGTIGVRLPKLTATSRVAVKIRMSSETETKDLVISGLVKPFNDGIIGEQWGDVVAETGSNVWVVQYYPTYDQNHHPIIWLGSNYDFGEATITLFEYFTQYPLPVDREQHNFILQKLTTMDGVSWLKSSVDDVAGGTGSVSRATVEEMIYRRYSGLFPIGIYNGFDLALGANDTILVGNPDDKNTALLAWEGDDVAITMNRSQVSVEVPGPGDYVLVLRLTSEAGEALVETDRDGVNVVVEVQETSASLVNTLRLASVVWPEGELFLTGDMIDINVRDNAQFSSGVFKTL